MNILILANRDLASNLALNLLLPRLQRHNLRVFLSSQVGKPGALPELKRLRFFELSLCNQLIFPHLPAPPQRPGKYCSFSQFDSMLNQPVAVMNQINSEQGLSQIRALKPDLILSIRYGGILKDPLIAIPEYGVINLHSGLLPDFRGVMATFWAMLKGEKEIGTTCHVIEDGRIDTGGIISTSRLTVEPDKSYLWHVLQLYPAGCELLVSAVQRIEQGQVLVSEPQPQGGQYFSFPAREHLDAFSQRGLKLVDEEEVMEFLKQHYY
ncbi:formyl transferase [Lacimicrobium alkaliphilum]|uniref:Formyl transferase n=1 Tax=Lacimicrobium alkaliphilum TaxID=1526571 RepID=A0A0U2ZL38_9ALTE|nr:formyl transferase [Lacimicrobium alkaliphilum]ALS99719.1 formyl transferase [Lacimicrobium alkaliphilum]